MPTILAISRILIAALTLSAAPGTATLPAGGRAELTERFDRLVRSRIDEALAKPGTNERGDIAWGEAYALQGLAEVLDRTRDPGYADLFVKLGDWVLAARDDHHGRRDDFRGRVVPAWSSTGYTGGKRYAWAVHTGMIVAPMARFAAIVRHDPTLAKRYAKDAGRFLKAAEESVAVHDDQYRDGPGPDEGYVYGLSLAGHLPLNMQNSLAMAWMYLDDATGTPTHRERIARLARFLKNRLRKTDDGAYVWAYRPPLDAPGGGFEDISHAAHNVNFMVRCCEHGIVFTRDDLARVEKTLLSHVLRDDDAVSDNVGGVGGTDQFITELLRWAPLAKHDTTVRDRLIRFYRSGMRGSRPNVLGVAYLITAYGPATTTAPVRSRQAA